MYIGENRSFSFYLTLDTLRIQQILVRNGYHPAMSSSTVSSLMLLEIVLKFKTFVLISQTLKLLNRQLMTLSKTNVWRWKKTKNLCLRRTCEVLQIIFHTSKIHEDSSFLTFKVSIKVSHVNKLFYIHYTFLFQKNISMRHALWKWNLTEFHFTLWHIRIILFPFSSVNNDFRSKVVILVLMFELFI